MTQNVSIKKYYNNVPVEDGKRQDTFHIHLQGLVQGVGFRPFVYKLAYEFGLKGWVNNSNDGVHIVFNATLSTAKDFDRKLIDTAPPLSRITKHSFSKIAFQKFDSFSIIESHTNGDATLMLTPDYAICDNCRNELKDKNNFRFHYPFITCTHCGPRYSIITSLPYDRPNTTMRDFEMCQVCDEEYNDVENRRHFSQTNSCTSCGISMKIYDREDHNLKLNNEAIIERITGELNDGKIVTVKGLGGYLLLCDATNEEAIKLLRKRKHRPVKPFAVMFPNLKSVKKVALLQKEEMDALQSEAAPIVLLRMRGNENQQICLNEIAPDLSCIGAMLPYTPLFELILSSFAKPVIATSANISESPIVYKDEKALESLFFVADFVITNNREIVVPQDDSVIQFTNNSKQKIIIRRSRGLAPSHFNYECRSDQTILATGALLKSTFTFVNKKNSYISQYLGNTESYEAQQAYVSTVQHFFDLFQKKPDVILTDKHPMYFSNRFAKETACDLNIDSIEIQHHKAHFAAALSENNLLHQSGKSNEKILGVIWDGTGFGDDGNIWGGEFFRYQNNQMKRVTHFDYFPFILGDKMPREPRISALASCFEISSANELLFNKFNLKEWELYHKMLQQPSLQCSSVGRIFDAVSSLLNSCDKQTFEGEAAMLLQEQAYVYFKKNNWKINESYFMENENHISTFSFMQQIASDIKSKKEKAFIAAKFHYSLVKLIEKIALHFQTKKIIFSGGVFLNSLLVDLLQLFLPKDFKLYFHKELSPNDENISFGQMVYYDQKIDQSLPVYLKKQNVVREKLIVCE